MTLIKVKSIQNNNHKCESDTCEIKVHHCNNFKLKVHVIKVNKGKIRPRSWDIYSKVNIEKTILMGVHFSLLWLRKLENPLVKEKRH